MRRTFRHGTAGAIVALAGVSALCSSCTHLLDVKTSAVVHNDAGQTGTQAAEFTLTPANVSKLVLLATLPVDDFVWAQPLLVPQAPVSGVERNVLYVATNNDTIYAFDEDRYTLLWSNHLATKIPNTGYVPAVMSGDGIGCFSTPVVDATNHYLYAVCAVSDRTLTLYKLNSLTGALVDSVTLRGSVSGNGAGSSFGSLSFSGSFELARPGLALANGNVYVSVGGWDTLDWHGWVFSYDARSLGQNGIWCSTPNSLGGSVWMSGGAPSVDANGNLYVTTGNGARYNGTTEFANSVVKLSPTLAVLDHFAPANWAALNAADADVSSNRFVLIPGTKFGVVAAKDFNVYVIDTTCMGGLQGSRSECTIQTFPTNASGKVTDASGSYGVVFMHGRLFLPLTDGGLYAFTWTGKSFDTTPAWHNNTSYGYPGPAQLSGSWNGSTNEILWMTTAAMSTLHTPQPAVLRALNPATGAEYWNSGGALGNLAKYNAPTVANGKVAVASQSRAIYIFGLPPGVATRP